MGKLSAVEIQIREALRAIGFGDLIVDPDGYKAPARIAHRP